MYDMKLAEDMIRSWPLYAANFAPSETFRDLSWAMIFVLCAFASAQPKAGQGKYRQTFMKKLFVGNLDCLTSSVQSDWNLPPQLQ